MGRTPQRQIHRREASSENTASTAHAPKSAEKAWARTEKVVGIELQKLWDEMRSN